MVDTVLIKELRRRLKVVRQHMAKEDLSFLYLSKPKNLFYLTCILCVTFVGCESGSNTMTAHPQQDLFQQHVTGLTGSWYSKGSDVKQTERLNRMNTNLDKTNEPTAITAFSKPETAKDNRKALEYEPTVTTAPKRTISEPIKIETPSPEEILAISDSAITNKTQPPSSTTINLPMLLDNPTMADELISVNFDRLIFGSY